MILIHHDIIRITDCLNYCFTYEGTGHSAKQHLLNFPQICTTVRKSGFFIMEQFVECLPLSCMELAS